MQEGALAFKQKTLAERLAQQGLVNVAELDPSFTVRLPYSTEGNFLRRNVYGDLRQCFLQHEAAVMLVKAHALLKQRGKGWAMLLWDGARPLSVQKTMWDEVKGTAKENFVANPETSPSVHNYGCAVDLTLIFEGKELDMGTPFDDFSPTAETTHEQTLLNAGLLSQEQLKNRLILRDIMEKVGFKSIPEEWWHFNAIPKEQAQNKYEIIL